MSTVHHSRRAFRVIATIAILALLMAAMVLTVSAADATKEVRVEMTIGQENYTVNGKTQTMDSVPYVNSDDRTMVPLRFLGEAIGADVSWDAAADTAVIVYGDQTIKFKLFENTMQVDDQIITIDTKSTIQNGRTMVPLRAAAEAIGSTVSVSYTHLRAHET